MSKKGFSLTELIVGAIIIASVFTGLIGTFLYLKGYVRHSRERLISVNLVRNVLENRYKDVREDQWDTGPLSVGTHVMDNADVDGIIYTGNYEVSDLGNRDYRQVTTNVEYSTYFR